MRVKEATETSHTWVRPASVRDREKICAMLGRAFWDDPTLVYFFPDEERRAARIERFFGLLFDVNHPLGACDVTHNFEASTMWRPPGRWRLPVAQQLAKAGTICSLFGADTARALSLLSRMEAAHPREPHWYLMDIGVEPRKQGMGYGKAVAQHRLKKIDAEGMPAYLESTRLSNVAIYQSWGFKRLRDVEVAPGLIFYTMWRQPQG